MAAQEPNHNLRRMQDLIRGNADSADDIYDNDDPAGKSLPDFVDTQVKINQEMVKTFAAITAQLSTVADDMEGVKGQQEFMAEDVALIKRRQETMADDIGQVKGGHARAEVAREAGVIALDLGLGYVRNVEKLELAVWAQKHSGSGIPASDLRSFRGADLVVQATNGPEIVYLAVEVSFTADKRDADRALRNATMLEQFTGCPAKAVVASVKNDNYVTEQVEKGLIHWHPIDQRSLEPD